MTVNPIVPSPSNQPQQVQSALGKDAEQAFGELTKSKSYNSEELQKATTERTRLTRTKKSDRTKKNLSLFLVSDDGELEEEPVYRTVMVDGIMFTLRLLAIA